MRKKVATHEPTRRNIFAGLLIGILILFGGLVVLFFQLLAPSQRTHATSTPTAPSQASSTVAGTVAQQFCLDMKEGNYAAAYSLLSPTAQQQLQPHGGATFLQEQQQTLTNKYGAITDCQIQHPIQGSEAGPTMVLIQVSRLHFQPNQQEIDTLTMKLEADKWLVDQWTTDITTR